MAIALLTADRANAQQCLTTDWSATDSETGSVISVPYNDTTFTAGVARSYYSHNQHVFARAIDGTSSTGWPASGWSSGIGETLQNFPIAAPSSNPAGDNCTRCVYLSGGQGILYKINADTGLTVAARDLKRVVSGVTCNDTIQGTPAVQLYQFSNTRFQNSVRFGTADGSTVTNARTCGGGVADLIFVIMRNGDSSPSFSGCASVDGSNQIHVLCSNNLGSVSNGVSQPTVSKIVYNSSGNLGVGFGAESGYLLYDSSSNAPNNMVFYGVNQVASQNSLFAFNTDATRELSCGFAGGTGSPKCPTGSVCPACRPILNWAINTGDSNWTRPQVATIAPMGGTTAVSQLIVMSHPGVLRSFDPGTGALLFASSPLPATVSRNPWFEFRGGALQNRGAVTDDTGIVHIFVETGSTTPTGFAELVPPLHASSGVSYTSMPLAIPGLDKYIIGRSDGHIEMFDSNGASQAWAPILMGGTVADPSLDVDLSTGALNRILVPAASGAGNGTLTRVVLPLPGASAGPGCVAPPPAQ